MTPRIIALVVIGVSACRSVAAQSRWDRVVDARLAQAAASLGRGYRAAGVAGRGTLNTGERATFSITLSAGAPLTLTGVCDDDCSDLDLSLATNGYDTDAARGGGNAPIVRVTPAASTTYIVTVQMGSCRVNPCWFAVGMFREVVTTAHPPSR